MHMPEDQRAKMLETPVHKLILSLAVPTTISVLVTTIYNMADAYFVGKLGTSASGAVGVVFSLMAILQALGFMLGHGAGSNISRMLGQQQTKHASKYASTSFFFALAFGGIIEVLGIVFLSPFMRFLGSSQTILPYAMNYGFFILLAAPFMVSSCVLNNILRYEGKASLAMVGLATGGILNILLDPILMFGLDLGMTGAGLATALSQLISFCLLLVMFLAGKTQSKLSIKKVTFRARDVLNIFRNGFPSLARQGLSSVSSMLLNIAARGYGDAAVAAMSICSKLCQFIASVMLGIGQGFQPVAGYNYGAGKHTRLRSAYRFTFLFGEAAMGTLAIVCYFLAPQLVALFRDDPLVVQIGVLAFRFQCVSLLFQPLTVVSNMLFQSIGKAGQATILACSRQGIFLIPLILILPNIIGILGVQISQAIAEVLSCGAAIPFVVAFFRKLPEDVPDPVSDSTAAPERSTDPS